MANEPHVRAALPTKRESRAVEEAIAALAARQHGVVSHGQLADLGVGAGGIKHRAALGRLHRMHRGVYAVGHRALRPKAWWMAAVLAAGPGAALSCRSAAEAWGIRNGSRARIEVSAPRNRRSTARLEVHVVEMQPDGVTVHDGIPVTTPARTLLDLGRRRLAPAPPGGIRRGGGPPSHEPDLPRRPRRALPRTQGTRTIARVLARHRAIGQTIPTSVLERRLLALIAAHGLPRPQIDRLTAEGELDAIWPGHSLVVHCDGFAGHGTRRAFEADRLTDRELVVAGWRVIRVTWRQLESDPETIARQLAVLLNH